MYRRSRRERRSPEHRGNDAPEEAAGENPGAGKHRATGGKPAARDRKPSPVPRAKPEPREPDPFEDTSFVRPYALTSGRTAVNYVLELETLVTTVEDCAPPQTMEQIAILEACRSPRSIAELASRLRVPVGVAKVLVSDAADANLVLVHRTLTGDDQADTHLYVMTRVLEGLRRL
ncbi:DUF742 domain-containing protein [Amycolatopsis acidicola]|uniref:DUF742 domain-containing protein n=1 Tax=Amycolatopsis acidicola TaxID=2596893 RepID=A0A5N0V278_9PSEU|nr:DUF742 domain-containing protein [Amycolatopsis acidicola]KAA9158746.1 DUF742 domain-containing protein [Amycolatopsis acidicola]